MKGSGKFCRQPVRSLSSLGQFCSLFSRSNGGDGEESDGGYMHCPLVLEMKNDESVLESWELVWVDHLGPGLVEPLNSLFVDYRARGTGTDERVLLDLCLGDS